MRHWKSLNAWLTAFLADLFWLIVWSVDCLPDWLTDCLSVCLSVYLSDCLTDCLTGWMTECLTDCLTDQLSDWLTDWMINLPFSNRLTDWMLSCSTIGAATSLLSMWNSKMNAIAASRHEEFAGRLQSTGNKAELYISPMDTGSNSRYKPTTVACREFPSRKIEIVCVTWTWDVENVVSAYRGVLYGKDG